MCSKPNLVPVRDFSTITAGLQDGFESLAQMIAESKLSMTYMGKLGISFVKDTCLQCLSNKGLKVNSLP